MNTPRTVAEIRAEAAQHARQIEAVKFLTVQELADRWRVDDETVRKIDRTELPFLEFGKSRMRRYDPREVERYEQQGKGESAA
jgi:hypothetical protein